MQETQVQSLGWEDPLEEEMAKPTPVFLLGKFHGQRSLLATVHGVTKSWTWLSDWAHTLTQETKEQENVSENLHITYCFFFKCTYMCTQAHTHTHTHTHTNLNKITPRCTKQNLPCERVWGSNNPSVKCPKTRVSAGISSIRIDTIDQQYSNQSWGMK